MGYLKDFLSGKTSRKIKQTKSKVADVKALRKFKQGKALTKSAEREGAKRAASRLGDSMAAFPVRSRKRGR